jgi:hypothetical protein
MASPSQSVLIYFPGVLFSPILRWSVDVPLAPDWGYVAVVCGGTWICFSPHYSLFWSTLGFRMLFVDGLLLHLVFFVSLPNLSYNSDLCGSC